MPLAPFLNSRARIGRRLILPALLASALAAQAASAEDPARTARTLAKANPPDQVAACSEAPRHIRVVVEDVRDDGGVITADLHDDDPDKWLVGKKKVNRERWKATPGTTEICLTVEKTGTYAIALYHDLDASGRLETNGLGIPVEPFGISNNPKIILSPPSVTEAAFEVPEDGVSLRISLKHGFRADEPPEPRQK